MKNSFFFFFFLQAEDGIRVGVASLGLGNVKRRQAKDEAANLFDGDRKKRIVR